MRLKFIGSGGAFAPISVGNSNMLLTENGKHMLIDCGITAPYILRDEWKMSHNDIDAVWVSHLHADHVGGLEWLAFMRQFVPLKGEDGKIIKPKIFGIREVLEELWNNTLRGGLESIEGRIMSMTEYFDCRPIVMNSNFTWEGYKFIPVQTIHVMSGYIFRYSFGLMIENKSGKKTFITTDTQYAPYQLNNFYEQADLIFHDCETTPFRSHVHAHYEELRTLPTEIKNKTWLYHYAKPIDTFKEDGFLGFVTKGQEFEI